LHANSLIPHSSQTGPHPRLLERVAVHAASHWRRPITPRARADFAHLQSLLTADWLARPIWIDHGCGTGESSRALAERNPGLSVLGIDQSLARLSRQGIGEQCSVLRDGRVIFWRSDLVDAWPLLAELPWRAQRHLLWYPNPWPKAEHLQRRWHAHPLFPGLLALGASIELRSNWRIYVDEFIVACQALGRSTTLSQIDAGSAVTPFERKYLESGHRCWQVLAA
jgi:tRNA G46 methylase TrmB